MSYISLILPAFRFNCKEKNEIQKQCCNQFNISKDNFELIEFKDGTNNINYGIIFKESCFCLSSIEDLIYERNCIQSLSAKTFESLKIITKKLNELESIINSFNEGKNYENLKQNLLLNEDKINIIDINDTNKINSNSNSLFNNDKLIEMKENKINNNNNEISDYFRKNTEKTLNKIKDEFKVMINNLEILSKKSENNINNNISSQREEEENNDFIDNENNNNIDNNPINEEEGEEQEIINEQKFIKNKKNKDKDDSDDDLLMIDIGLNDINEGLKGGSNNYIIQSEMDCND